MSDSKIKTGQLWGKDKDELKKQLEELRQELVNLRTQAVSAGGGSKLMKIHNVRKSIARVCTVINATHRAQLRLFYNNKKYIPLDLRPKKTRALRRKLSPTDAARLTVKEKKKRVHFPKRLYAVKAS